MSTHTPEPWVADGSKVEGDYIGWMHDVAYCPTFLHRNCSGDANAARIVACVNACAGMADPAKEIAELRAEVERLKGKASVVLPPYPTSKLNIAPSDKVWPDVSF